MRHRSIGVITVRIKNSIQIVTFSESDSSLVLFNMATTITGTLPMTHIIDPSGSMIINVPILLLSSRFNPILTFAYHSSAIPSKLGYG